MFKIEYLLLFPKMDGENSKIIKIIVDDSKLLTDLSNNESLNEKKLF